MENSLDNIRSLIMQEIDGDISDGDRQYLLQLASENLEVSSLRTYLWETVGSPEVNNYLLSNPAEAQSKKLLHRIRRRKIRSIIYASSSVAAAAVLAFGIFKMLQPIAKDPLNISVVDGSLTQHKQVELSLSSGDNFVLNGDTSLSGLPSTSWKVNSKTLSYSGNRSVSSNTAFATLKVPAGKDYSLVLGDGTQIQVNSASLVRFPLNFDNQSRDIYITGEAYVKASSNPSKPLRVHLPNSLVEVLGTEFNVNTYDSVSKIALVSGKVRVGSSEENVVLSPGTMCTTLPTGMHVGNFDTYETLSWRTGQFVFRNAKFEDVCKVIPRWFGVSIVMDNQKLSTKRFSGVIDRSQPLDIQLQGLQATGALSYRVTADSTIHIVFN